MAISQCMPVGFKYSCLAARATHDLKIALYTAAATLGASTTAYTATGEVTATGYTAGGVSLAGAVVSTEGSTAYMSFDNVVFNATGVVARGALIYDADDADEALAVLDFGADKSDIDGVFTVNFPEFTATSAVIRLD